MSIGSQTSGGGAAPAKAQVAIGHGQLSSAQDLARVNYGLTQPLADAFTGAMAQNLEFARTEDARHKGLYSPMENLQALDAMGFSWLNEDAQNQILQSQFGHELTSLEDAFNRKLSDMNLSYQRAGDNPLPAKYDSKGKPITGQTTDKLKGTTGTQSTRPRASNLAGFGYQGTSVGMGPPASPVTSEADRLDPTYQEKLDAEYARNQTAAQEEFELQKGQLERNQLYAQELSGITRSAETAAEGRAMADVRAAENRHRNTLATEAGRMGIDPSRLMMQSAANAPGIVAQAVGAGNQARFGIRDQRTAGIGNTVNQGNTANQLAISRYGAGGNAGTTAANIISGALNTGIQAPTTASSFYGTGVSGMNAANPPQANPVTDILGTGLGIWAGAGFPGISDPKKKKKKQKADTPETLEMVKNMDTDSWEYTDAAMQEAPGMTPPGRHVGPYADQMQDMGLSDGQTVNPNDTAGLALAGVKQLAKDMDQIKQALGIPAPQMRAA
jgi:hypothetical protein